MKLERHFFPMRPDFGVTLTARNWRKLVAKLAGDYLIQPKLNGDRVCIFIEACGAYAQNRHGSQYGHSIRNLAAFASLPAGTVLDGEVFGGNFYPFDVASMDAPVEDRTAAARAICDRLGIRWLWDAPNPDFYANPGLSKASGWEGIVCKRRGDTYRPLRSARWTSNGWLKLKWA